MDKRNRITEPWQKFLQMVHQLDQHLISFLRQRSTLLAALIGVFLILWGGVQGDGILVLEVLLAGAIAYAVGFTPAVIGAMLLMVYRLGKGTGAGPQAADEILQFLGCVYIAWLGYWHGKMASYQRKCTLESKSQTHHLISWVFINEVRNSLMAMRLLLFQSKKSTSALEYKMVEKELLRLERMFSELQKEKEEPRKR